MTKRSDKLPAQSEPPYPPQQPQTGAIRRWCQWQHGTNCRVHVVFHGCQQSVDDIGLQFVLHTGYNAWADANSIMMLYPQAQKNSLNPKSCWDWWGYTGRGYLTRAAPQIIAVRHMLEQLAGARTSS